MSSPKYGVNSSYDKREWNGLSCETKILLDKEIGYVAGFLDGEGHISFCHDIKQGRSHCYWQVAFTNTDLRVIEFLQSVVGGRIYGRDRENGHKKCYTLNIRKQEILSLFPQIIDSLIIKKEQAKLLLNYFSNPHLFSTGTQRIRSKVTRLNDQAVSKRRRR